jgi:hypothetical protein
MRGRHSFDSLRRHEQGFRAEKSLPWLKEVRVRCWGKRAGIGEGEERLGMALMVMGSLFCPVYGQGKKGKGTRGYYLGMGKVCRVYGFLL